MTTQNWLFKGFGQEQSNTAEQIEQVDTDPLKDPKHYQASRELAAAVNVAITLGMPLLLTGEPGCGKSELARRIHWEMGFPGEVLSFSVKSTTEAKDLFYTFDTVGRFHAAYTQQVASANTAAASAADAVNFIHYQALGLALLRAKGNKNVDAAIMQQKQHALLPPKGQRSVVLIDEIDKAPREVPNDILNEIDQLEFNIPELEGHVVKLNPETDPRPVVIITSNSERDLPEAFLRRCVFHHVAFPPFESTADIIGVRDIVAARFASRFVHPSPLLDDVINLCQKLREQAHQLNKLPSLAELLNWIDLLLKSGINSAQTLRNGSEERLDFVRQTALPTLLKTIDDHKTAEVILQEWWQAGIAEHA